MRLQELRITNFRQFHGQQEVTFASGAKNITVIHGYNGSGKTALLNAFVWCLYGRVTDDLEAPDRLLNEAAASELKAAEDGLVEVRLRFVAGGLTYTAQRQVVYRKDPSGALVPASDPGLSLWRVGESGAQEKVANAQNVIDQILPQRLYPFFFFNGERVESIASPDAYNDVEEGIKTLLDVEIYERSVRHLREQVVTELSRDLRQFGSDEATKLDDRLNALMAQETQVREKLTLERQNFASVEKELEDIDQALHRLEAVRELQSRRRELEVRRNAATVRVEDIRGQRARQMSKNGFLAFAAPVLEDIDERVRDARQKGELPAKVKPQFVDDLLGKGTCVCGRPIGHAEEEHLKAWRSTTGLADLEEQISMTAAVVPTLRSRRVDYFGSLDQMQDTLAATLAEKRRIDEELDEISTKIGGDTGEEAAGLERRRNEERGRQLNLGIEISRAEEKLQETEAQLREVRGDLEKVKIKNEKAGLIQRQIHAVNRIADALDKIYTIQKQDVRRELSERVSQVWNGAAIKDYRASVTVDFRLDLKKMVAGVDQPVHGASTGEKQVLALSFVGSLVWKARRNEERNQAEGGGLGRDLVVGGEYPLVMDSPFGALEDDYRRKVAEWIPSLASQVVVMASKTQWRNEVESAMRPRIGREYVLELHTPKANADRSIELGGHEHPYVRETAGPEKTIIREVK
ncbi:MAG TPA: AAA family ATPase [Polyangiaceae bacterium]